ncbi:hypothetical protein JOC95_001808 [Bacillus tianshenii]|uniref:Uncharacterized protein n=1 Tax=Sutcliffiella tianshenii TaxID=1463404 RepID=A0ABS2NZ86_9BACI|nr:hypothetical protein [Bacillus tianshenii]MBM7619956.1 hypothetical protein [Bacillus tianshenii]
MGKRLTSGPFFVPISIDGSASGAVEFLLIGLKNLASRTSTVHVSVYNCRDTSLYPPASPEVKIYQRDVCIPAGACAVLKVDAEPVGKNTFTGNNMLRVELKGDTDEDAKAVVIALSGGRMDGRTATSMVFKHDEFVEFDD